jgi:cytosine/adenosine deaminase-related metal-dependent hydrolase
LTLSLVHGGHLLEGFLSDDEAQLHADAAIAVAEGVVQALGPFAELRRMHPDARLVGSAGCVVMPGLINAHHHVGLTPLQLGSPDHSLELWFASRLGLRDVDLYLDTLYSAFEMIASGVTTVQHLHSRVPGSAADVLAAAHTVIGAYRDIGMRASYSTALRDQNRLVYGADRDFVARLPSELQPDMSRYFARFAVPLVDQIAIFDDLHRAYAHDPLIRVQIAPSNLHWLSDSALEAAAEMSARTAAPMHMHLLETPYQKAYADKRTGGSALAHIHKFGLTGPLMTLGHGVWMTEADIELCAATGTRLCHNCSSNFRLKSGLAPVNRLRARDIPVAIGIDEAGINDDRDMLQEMRLILHAHREPGIDAPHPSPAAVLRMATEHGAGTTPFAGSIGRLSQGSAADLVVLDWNAVTYPYQSEDIPLVDVLVQRAKSSAVKTVMIGGAIVYEDGRFTRVDRDAILAEIAGRLSRPLSPDEEARRELARAVLPHVRRFYDGYLEGLGDEPHYRPSSRL